MLNILLLVLGALVVWVVIAFNGLIRDRNRVSQSWSDVDVQLLRRHDLVPRLVEMVKGYSGFEKAVHTSLAELRAAKQAPFSPGARGDVEKSVAAGVSQLVALVEAYPDLKASGNFLQLQQQLADAENQIQYARRYYNGAVNLYNNRLQRFPDLVVARSLGFQPREFFQLEDDTQAAAPAVTL